MSAHTGGTRTRNRHQALRIPILLAIVAGMIPGLAANSYAFVPETLHKTFSAAGWGRSGVGPALLDRSLPFRATHLAVTWQGSGPPPKIRTSSDGMVWSGWKQATESTDMFDPTTQTHYSDLLAGGAAKRVQLSSAGTRQGSLAVAVINTRDGPLRAVRLPHAAAAQAAQPNVVGRRAWGADESIRRGNPSFQTVRQIFVHHTVTPNNADPAETIRAIYAYHVRVRGWEDIGYNFLIDSAGNVYEGRYSRPYSAGDQPSGEDATGRGVVGAHTEGHNEGSTGIALLGNADSQAPSKAAVDSLVNVVAWKAGRHKIDPMGTGGSSPNVAGHRDASGASTECPGAHLYQMMPSIRQRAKQIVDSGARPSGPVGELIGPILNGPAPGLGDSVSDLLGELGL